MKKRRCGFEDMDDYRDLVEAGFAVLCAALMLVAGLLFLNATEESKPAREIEPPSMNGRPLPQSYYFECRRFA